MRLILVDDNERFRSLLKTVVEQVPNYQVVAEAADGAAAVETIRNTEADLVVLDLSLPKLSGIGVLKEIRKFTSAPVLALTMYSEKDIINQVMAAGADGVCLKEHSRNILVDAMVKTAQGERPIYTDNYKPDAVPSKE